MNPVSRGHLAMLTFSALVAGSFSLGSLAANEISPNALTAIRFLLATGVIGLVAMATGGLPRDMWRAPWRYFILGGLFAAYFVLMFEGLKTAAPVSTAAVFTLTPLISAGFGWTLLRQITTRRMAIALGIGATGALWVIFRADWHAFLQFRVGQGEMYYFCGCVLHAAYTPMVRKLNRGEASVAFSFGSLAAGCILLAIWGWNDIVTTDWAGLPSIVWITLGYLTVFSTAATFVLLQYASLNLPSAKVMAYTYLVPSWVTIWEIALGHGAPNLLILIGVVLTVIALLLLLRDEH
ncbi:MAG: DMT family transporter [Tateyamaria sp.]|uniref:DMT family transporter n=1 Tax=Roseobacteraceae TaxID=2854170 RepID=UPI0032971293